MTGTELVTVYKVVPDMLVAAVRYRGKKAEVPGYLARLAIAAGPHAAGKSFCRYLDADPEQGYLIEACLPVSQAIEADGITTFKLSGGEMLCTRHAGPYDPPDTADNLTKTWQQLWGYVTSNNIDLAEEARREVYLEGPLEHGTDQSYYVTELQLALLLPRWLRRLQHGLAQNSTPAATDAVMAGCVNLSYNSAPVDKARWAIGAMEKLEQQVPDAAAHRSIMAGCAHIYPQVKIDEFRAKYLELGSLDALIDHMRRAAESRCGAFAVPRREGDRLLITKVPRDPAAMATATTDRQRREYYCHCGLVRALIAEGREVSDTFCYCGTGWFKRWWEGVLDAPVEVEVVSSVLCGGDDCTFSIKLPPGV